MKESCTKPLPQRMIPISVLETSTEFRVKADLPGVSRDDIRVDFELGNLFLEAKVLLDQSSDQEILIQEFGPCLYKRTLKMSSEIESEAIEATFESGVLIVCLPKKKTAVRQKIPIFCASEKSIEN